MVDLEAGLLTEIFQPLLRHATFNLFLGKYCLLICTFWLNDVSMLSACTVCNDNDIRTLACKCTG